MKNTAFAKRIFAAILTVSFLGCSAVSVSAYDSKPNGLIEMSTMFRNCPQLKIIKIPVSVTKIGDYIEYEISDNFHRDAL